MVADLDRARYVSRRVKQLIEPIGAAPFASTSSFEAAAELGIDDPLVAYVAFRSAPLGVVGPTLVGSVFGPFNSSVIESAVRAIQARTPLEHLLTGRDEGAAATLTSVLGEPDSAAIDEAVALLDRAASALPVVGRAMFAARRDLIPSVDPWTALWRACDEIREHRGDSHTISWAASGLDAVEVNLLTAAWVGMPFELRTSLMGFDQHANDAGLDRVRQRGLLDGDELTELGQATRDQLEGSIDAQQIQLADTISDIDLTTIEDILGPWGTALIDAGAYPAPPESVFPI